MRQILTALFILIYTSLFFAQEVYKPSETLLHVLTGSTIYKEKTLLTYDEKGRIADSVVQYEGMNGWEDNSHTSFRYEGDLLSEWLYEYSDYGVKNSQKVVYGYENGKITSQVYYNLYEGAWSESDKYAWVYGADGKIVKYITSSAGYDSESSENIYDYYYNSNGDLDSVTALDAMGNLAGRSVYKYSNSGKTVEILTEYADYDTGEMTPYYKYVTNYNNKGLVSDSLGWQMTANDETGESAWEASFSLHYAYDSEGRVATETSDSLNDYTSAYKTEKTYAKNGEVLSLLYSVASEGKFYPNYEYTYEYGANNKILSESDSYWDSESKEVYQRRKTLYKYDDKGKMILKTSETSYSEADAPEPETKVIVTYDENGNPVLMEGFTWNSYSSRWEGQNSNFPGGPVTAACRAEQKFVKVNIAK